MPNETSHQGLSDEERRDFLKVLGIAAGAAVGGKTIEELTLDDVRDAVTVESAGELAERGRAIRTDMSGTPDSGLIETEMAGIAGAIDSLPEVREAGVPEMGASVYAELTDAAWRVDEHLTDVGFYESAEVNLPPFGVDHIQSTTRQLVRTEAVEPVLSEVGFDEQAQFDLVGSVATRVEHLEMWQPTWMLEHDEVEEIQAEWVEPLHRRAAGGALNWIDGLDHFFAQREVLITDEILDAAVADVNKLLGGFYLLSAAAEALARGEIGDAELTALVTGSAGILITGQMDLQYDAVRITEAMRAPPQRRAGR